MKILVLEKTENCMPVTFKQGDWIDLKTAEDIILQCPTAKTLRRKRNAEKEGNDEDSLRIRDVVFSSALIRLGVCIQVPKGYECILAPRSSAFKKFGILQTNSIGVIDQTFCSTDDEWKMSVIATRGITIPKGTRIAQFRVQLSQKATAWQKIKWLFSSTIKVVRLDKLSAPVRGGFGEGTDNKEEVKN